MQKKSQLEILLNKETNIDPNTVLESKIAFILVPFEPYQKKLEIMKNRTTSMLILVLNKLRSRIGFFFLFNFLDKCETEEVEKEIYKK